MLQGVDVRDKVVLEPSAGSGSIVEVLKEMGVKNILVYELDPLRAMVRILIKVLK